MIDVVEEYRYNEIPIDTIWSDIDYMDHYNDFTVDVRKFDPSELNQWLIQERLHYVPIIDAGIAIGNNDAYK
jgi:alpha-glucosidase (family GH31 glycosyl hydrolase)